MKRLVLCSGLILVLPAILLFLFPFEVLAPQKESAPFRQTGLNAGPVVRYPIQEDVSPVLREVPPLFPKLAPEEGLLQVPVRPLPERQTSSLSLGTIEESLSFQDWMGPASMPAPVINFEGLRNSDNIAILGTGVLPPDTTGDIGLNHYVQWVNLIFSIWEIDRSNNTAKSVYGPAGGNTLWRGFGGMCETHNNGDPMVLYDTLADRWLMSQFALDFLQPEFHQCVAISQSGDPTGAWYRYDYLISTEKANDYPKFGAWTNAYYLTFNQFKEGSEWAGQGVAAFEKAKLLAGLPGAMVLFDLFEVDPYLGGMLPADLDGHHPPPDEAPGYFVQIEDNAWGRSADRLQIWKFRVDWRKPLEATFTRLQSINLATVGLAFDSKICEAYRGRCIHQPGTDAKLESLSDRLMQRLAYRNFGDYESLVVNHTVDAGGLGRAGIRWYELRIHQGVPSLYQAGTYAPDTDHRWMASLAMDASGNIALGYSISNEGTFPSIRYTGRLAGDPLDTLPLRETTLVEGGGSQISLTSRWGDYSSMVVDPTDDCTFWYTQEYYAITGSSTWQTRIGAFRFPTCSTGPFGSLHGRVIDATSGIPVGWAVVRAGEELTTLTDAEGVFRFINIPPGIYDLSASAYGYMDQRILDINVAEASPAVLDFTLQRHPPIAVSGNVIDASGHGWPLYARLDISSDGYANTVYTNPFNGTYSVDLFQNLIYTFSVRPISPGYHPVTAVVRFKAGTPDPISGFNPQIAVDREDLLTLDPDDAILNFTLKSEKSKCVAPGYRPEFVYFEDFESWDGGFTVEMGKSPVSPSWEWGTPASGPPYPHSGANVWSTNLDGNYADREDSYLVSPAIDLSAYVGQNLILTWWQWLNTEPYADLASLEITKDGGLTWKLVYGEIGGEIDTIWTAHRTILDPSYAVKDFRLRFRLRASPSITAPGYYVDDVGIGAFPVLDTIAYQEDFENSDGGYSVNGQSSWAWGIPASGPKLAHSGQRVWGTNLAGDYGNFESGYLASPPIDLSNYYGQTLVLSWWQWLDTESGFDFPGVEVSQDGGKTWKRVYGDVSGNVDLDWTLHRVVLDPVFAIRDFRMRFTLVPDMAVTAPGMYLDDVTITALPATPTAVCDLQPGGLVTGAVFAMSQSLEPAEGGAERIRYGLNGVRVSRQVGEVTTTISTPEDTRLDEGFYILFAPTGSHTFTASWGAQNDTRVVNVIPDQISKQDFYLRVAMVFFPYISRFP